MEEEKKEQGMATSEFTDFFQELQGALDECLVENEKYAQNLLQTSASYCIYYDLNTFLHVMINT